MLPAPLGLPGDLDRPAAAVVHPHDHAGRPGGQQLPYHTFQLGLSRCIAKAPHGRRRDLHADVSGDRLGGCESWPVEYGDQAGHGK
ncbi:hypothetical protein GCM10010289_02480 [Streptomyces violascens]|nr:hypothetical protein GCM10010289_02480 [Streptomyces violascens]